MLVCNAGMSTSMLVKKMNEITQKEGKKYKIYAVSTSKIQEEISENNIDVILLGPQVRYMEESIKSQIKDIPLKVIDMLDYGTMNAQNVIKMSEQLF